MRPTALLVLGLAASGGCGTVSSGPNVRLGAVHESIVDALRRDELARARALALELEGRAPGADSFALLGDVLWRTGELVDAEGLFRRAEAGGAPRGRLGLARSALAGGRPGEVRELVEPLRAVPDLAEDAHLLLAAIFWHDGDRASAAMELAAASATGGGARPWPAVEAMALLSGGDGALLDWRGATSALEMDSQGRVPVTVGGRVVRLVVTLDGRRTTIGGAAALALAPGAASPAVSAQVAEVRLGDLHALAIVRFDPEVPGDGILGADLLATLAWELSVGERQLRVASPSGRGARDLAPADLGATNWGTARLPRVGLGLQLLLRPRIGGQVTSAVVDVAGRSRLSQIMAGDVVAEGESGQPGDQVDLELRLGARRQSVSWLIDDLLPMGSGGIVAPRAVVGVDVLTRLRLRWQPDRLQVSYEEIDIAAPAAAGR